MVVTPNDDRQRPSNARLWQRPTLRQSFVASTSKIRRRYNVSDIQSGSPTRRARQPARTGKVPSRNPARMRSREVTTKVQPSESVAGCLHEEAPMSEAIPRFNARNLPDSLFRTHPQSIIKLETDLD